MQLAKLIILSAHDDEGDLLVVLVVRRLLDGVDDWIIDLLFLRHGLASDFPRCRDTLVLAEEHPRSGRVILEALQALQLSCDFVPEAVEK